MLTKFVLNSTQADPQLLAGASIAATLIQGQQQNHTQ
jgi:hypothetical protein